MTIIQPNAADHRILIVEDDEGIAELEKRALERAGYEIAVAGTVAEALSLLDSDPFSAVLLDHRLPDSLGWPVLEAAVNAITSIPVILVTAQGDENVAAEAVRLGAADYVVKRGDFLDSLAYTVQRAITSTDTDRALQRMRQLQSSILNSVDSQIVLLNEEGVIVLVNRAWKEFGDANGLKLLDYGVGSNYLDHASMKTDSESAVDPKARAGLLAVLKGEKESFAFEYPCHAPSKRRWFRMQVAPVREEMIKGVVISHINITDRMLAEQAQEQKTKLLSAVLESVNEGILVQSADGEALEWNQAAAAITGLDKMNSLAELDTRFSDGVTPCPREQLPIIRALDGESVFDEELVIRKGTGERVHVSVNANPLLTNNGNVTGAVATFRDITEQVLRNRTIKQMAAAVEQTADSVFITSIDGRIEYVNPAIESLTGYSRDELVGANPRLFKSDVVAAATFTEMWETITAGKVWTGRLTNRSKNAELFQVDMTIAPVRDEAGVVQQFVATLRDVTAQINLEKQFRQSQKMEAIGQLAGGIAHDFNNLLTVMRGYSEMLLDETHLNDTMRENVAHIIHAADSAAQLTSQLLAFGRRQVLNTQLTSPNKLLRDLQKMMNRIIPATIEMELVLASEIGMIEIDAGQFEQVLINLVMNACDAMPKGGSLKIITELAEISEHQANSHLNMVAGSYVRIQISDTGTGMSPELLNRIFEPFYTTKEVGKGTGLGLSTVYGIVKQSGGYIWPYSEVGYGTIFNLYFPHLTESAVTETATLIPEPQLLGNERILVLEDSEDLRNFLDRGLKQAGYTVLTAANANDALELILSDEEKIDLVVSDVILPDVTGPEFIEKIRKRGFNVKVIFMSGYTPDRAHLKNTMQSADVFVQKPFTIKAMLKEVRGVLKDT